MSTGQATASARRAWITAAVTVTLGLAAGRAGGARSVTWMAVITIVVLAQKLLPPRALVDVPVALAITALGILIVVAPSSVSGLMPPM